MKKILDTLLYSSIGRKMIMGLTGLGALSFLVGHLGGNMLIYLGEGALNEYADKLHSIPILPLIEISLAAMFLIHIIFGIILTVSNWKARPERYVKDVSAGSRTVASSTMIYTGTIILIFMVTHVFGMKMGVFSHELTFTKVKLTLTNQFFFGSYIVAFFALMIHLYHGIGSIFQSLGLRYPKYDKIIDICSKIAAIIICLLFISIPIYIYFFMGGVK